MNIEDKVREFVIDNLLFGESQESFLNDDSFLEKGLIDSIGILTLIEFVKERFAIAVEDDELIPDNWDSVQRITRFIDRKLSAKLAPATPSSPLVLVR